MKLLLTVNFLDLTALYSPVWGRGRWREWLSTHPTRKPPPITCELKRNHLSARQLRKSTWQPRNMTHPCSPPEASGASSQSQLATSCLTTTSVCYWTPKELCKLLTYRVMWTLPLSCLFSHQILVPAVNFTGKIKTCRTLAAWKKNPVVFTEN